MATNLTGARQQFYLEDVNAGVSVSQALAKKLAAGVQFINDRQHMVYSFYAGGAYDIATPLPMALGLPEVIEYDAEIVNVWVGNETTGTGGPTEVDLRRAVLGSSTYNTLFTTTPKFANTSASGDIIDHEGSIVAAPTGVTRPVLASMNLSAGDKIKMYLVTALTGGRDCWIHLHIKPR